MTQIEQIISYLANVNLLKPDVKVAVLGNLKIKNNETL